MAKDIVTNQQLYNAMMDIQRDLGGKVTRVHERLDEVVEERITPLEVWRGNIMGQIAAVGFIFILAIDFFKDWVREKIKL